MTSLFGLTVQGQRDVPLVSQVDQVGQQPGVAPGRHQHIRVLALEDGAQVDQQGAWDAPG